MSEQHFDMYSVTWKGRKEGWHIIQIFRNLSVLSAEIIANVDEADFCQSMENSGWLGTCPEWCHFRPVVTIPRGDKLSLEQLEFIAEAITWEGTL